MTTDYNPSPRVESSPKFVQIMVCESGEIAALDSDGVIWIYEWNGQKQEWKYLGSRKECGVKS